MAWVKVINMYLLFSLQFLDKEKGLIWLKLLENIGRK